MIDGRDCLLTHGAEHSSVNPLFQQGFCPSISLFSFHSASIDHIHLSKIRHIDMSGVISRDHALPNGGSEAAANPNNADPGGMTNQEKQAVGSVLQRDINKGAAVHVSAK
jgi:hypothetical protein